MSQAAFQVFRKDVAVQRRGEGEYVKGDWIETSTPIEFIIQSSVRPSKGEDLVMVPEGRYTTDQVTMYTDTLLKTAETSHQPDLVHVHDGWYEVVKLYRSQSDIINHYKVIAAKPNPQGPADAVNV